MAKFQTIWDEKRARQNLPIFKDLWGEGTELWEISFSEKAWNKKFPGSDYKSSTARWRAYVIKPPGVPIWECKDPHFHYLVDIDDCVKRLEG